MQKLLTYQINMFLALTLVFVGLWSYEASGRDLHTLSVPVLGVLLSLLHSPLKTQPQKYIKFALAASMFVFVLMLLPLRNSILAGHNMAILRVGLILVVSGWALFSYYYRIKNK